MELTSLQLASMLLVGILIGIISGMLGIGGGILVIPALVMLYQFSYVKAVGTSLGMLLPPIGIFAFLAYYRHNSVHVPAAIILAVGFAVGAFIGAKLVNTGKVPQETLRILFAFFLLYVAGSILFRTDVRVRPTLNTIVLVAAAAVTYIALRTTGKRWVKQFQLEEIFRRQLNRRTAPDYEI